MAGLCGQPGHIVNAAALRICEIADAFVAHRKNRRAEFTVMK